MVYFWQKTDNSKWQYMVTDIFNECRLRIDLESNFFQGTALKSGSWNPNLG